MFNRDKKELRIRSLLIRVQYYSKCVNIKWFHLVKSRHRFLDSWKYPLNLSWNRLKITGIFMTSYTNLVRYCLLCSTYYLFWTLFAKINNFKIGRKSKINLYIQNLNAKGQFLKSYSFWNCLKMWLRLSRNSFFKFLMNHHFHPNGIFSWNVF